MSTKLFTFKGGVHPPQNKTFTQNVPIEDAVDPKIVVIPLSQHIGAPCDPLVAVGDTVKVGQKIGESKAFVSVPVHSSVSGTVKKIEQHQVPGGSKVNCIIIESDGKFEVHESVQPKGSLESLSKDEILSIIKEAGMAGMGGAAFPTHVKLAPPKDKVIDVLLVNGAECEPYLTADHRIMLEKPELVMLGIKAIKKALSVEKCYIAIEKNKPDAIETLQKLAQGEDGIEVCPMEVKYPQGDEKRIINAITGRIVPSGGLPMEVGCVVENVGTVATIGNVFLTGMPAVQRVVTVSGSAVKNPKNIYVRIGTLFKDVIEQCGGYSEEPGKILNGGPMMGIAQFTDEVPVVKGTSGILVFNKKDAQIPEPSNCILCGRCVEACPVYLQPYKISRFSMLKKFDEADELHGADCIECGGCSYVCPAKRPLKETISIAKKEILTRRKKAK
ncbi:Electron transport complex subunit RnfC [anaerobic digester metagenome]|uniref:Ion-translocating oxidoreductase complex subunit C n=1 Tax=Sedimentibacter saalensis TaxID=130788 RepID=A0A562J9K4_9FIRM|nr:electron transport complex subunit RsxC [Sedimentibacter saalensis]TWH79881.1 electron transport complex protein RnfC [Sedimentibacter saalensis]